jgi:alkylglycerol monooxygenase
MPFSHGREFPCSDFTDLHLKNKTMNTIFIIILLALIAFEWTTGKISGRNVYRLRNSIINSTLGVITIFSEFICTFIALPLLNYIYPKHSLFHFDNSSAITFIILFFLIDFSDYWFHRVSHRINLFWTAHIVHHQSEHYNITVGLRASFLVPVFNLFSYSLFPLFGFSPQLVLVILLVQGLYNLVIHTELIGKLGWLEYILVTPSAHRVHHAKNEKYMDKNFGKLFIFWDLLFGTYIRESEKVEFGVADIQGGGDGIGNALFNPMKKISRLFFSQKNRSVRFRILFGTPSSVEKIFLAADSGKAELIEQNDHLL